MTTTAARQPTTRWCSSPGTLTKSRNDAWWKGQFKYRDKDYTAAELQCLLTIAGYLSTVFDETTDASTLDLAFDVLEGKNPPKGELRKLEQELLTAWLNFAAGVFDLNSTVEDHKNKTLTTFIAAVGQAESARLNPLTTEKELKKQREILNHINNHGPE